MFKFRLGRCELFTAYRRRLGIFEFGVGFMHFIWQSDDTNTNEFSAFDSSAYFFTEILTP
jgi:hypothetical protein